jgi:hypothetical protein
LTQVLLYQAANEIASGQLEIVLAEYAAEPLPVSIIYTGVGRMPVKTRTFVDFAAPRLKSALDTLGGLLRGTAKRTGTTTSGNQAAA